MTEAEAATKWCPMLNFHLTNNANDPPITNLPGNGKTCIGSECMVWRWSGGQGGGPNDQGYCGLGR